MFGYPRNVFMKPEDEKLYEAVYLEAKKALDVIFPNILVLIKKAKEEANEILLILLNQSCGDGLGKIDNMCISAYEDACEYLKKEGLLEEVNKRIYNIKELNKPKEE